VVVSGGFDGQAGDAPFVVRGTLIGYFFGLASAVTWALSSILIKSQSDRLSVLSINWLRCGTASIVMLLVLAVLIVNAIVDLLYPVLDPRLRDSR